MTVLGFLKWLALVAGLVSAKRVKRTADVSNFFDSYPSRTQVYDYLHAVCGAHDECSVLKIGKAAGSKKPISVATLKRRSQVPEMFVMCGMHGREWVSITSCLWLLNSLLSDDSEILSKVTVHVLPMLNPDGYEFTRGTKTSSAREWRKNRRYLPCKGDRCAHGVDLNRNWGVAGLTFGFGATRPTSDVYQGKRPFSEPEISAVKSFLLKRTKIVASVDVHCCAKLVLPPSYYHSESESVKNAHLSVAAKMADAMGPQYSYREREKEFSPTNSGVSVDWIFGETSSKYAFIVESRGSSSKKLDEIFHTDESDIEPIAQEVLRGVLELVNVVVSEGKEESSEANESDDDDDADDLEVTESATAAPTALKDDRPTMEILKDREASLGTLPPRVKPNLESLLNELDVAVHPHNPHDIILESEEQVEEAEEDEDLEQELVGEDDKAEDDVVEDKDDSMDDVVEDKDDSVEAAPPPPPEDEVQEEDLGDLVAEEEDEATEDPDSQPEDDSSDSPPEDDLSQELTEISAPPKPPELPSAEELLKNSDDLDFPGDDEIESVLHLEEQTLKRDREQQQQQQQRSQTATSKIDLLRLSLLIPIALSMLYVVRRSASDSEKTE